MPALPFSWRLELASGERIWTATVGQGTYTINQRRMTAQFIRLAPFASIELMLRVFASLEEAQIYCELHWSHMIRKGGGSPSSATDPHSARERSRASSAGSGLRRIF